MVVPNAAPPDIALPQVSTSNVDLTAAITPADVTALIDNLNAAAESLSSTVSSVAGLPGQTLVGALNSAAGLNNTLWEQLIRTTDNPTLVDVLTALRAASNGGLTKLAATVGSSNDTVTLTSGQVTELLTSTMAGSLATALHALTNAINNPLSASSYTGLVNVPLNIAGLGLNSQQAPIQRSSTSGQRFPSVEPPNAA